MKNMLVIGMGRFGQRLAERLLELKNNVMIVDDNADRINILAPHFTNAQIADCTNPDVLKALGVDTFDICFVTIGEDFQSSLVITSLLKKHGARCIVAKASQDIQADLLHKIGADEVVYPEVEIAEKLAVRHNANNIFDFVPLTEEYSIYEIAVPAAWAGRSLAELDLRRKYRINILALKTAERLNPNPSAEDRFSAGDHVIVLGRSNEVFKLAARA